MFTTQEVQALKNLLNQVGSSKSKPRRRNRRAKPAQNNLPAQTPSAPKRNRRRRRNVPQGADGSIRVARTEFFRKVQLDAKMGLDIGVKIVPDQFSWLKTLALCFDRIVWHSIVVEYRPYSSAMNSGSVAVGMDWNSSVSTVERDKVLACTPSFQTSVFQGRSLVFPPNMLMNKKSYSTVTSDKEFPGTLLISAASDKASLYAGDIYIRYEATLSGTNA